MDVVVCDVYPTVPSEHDSYYLDIWYTVKVGVSGLTGSYKEERYHYCMACLFEFMVGINLVTLASLEIHRMFAAPHIREMRKGDKGLPNPTEQGNA